jgi:hypothetical protein
MKEIWTFALRNPMLLLIPAGGALLSIFVLRIKKRYVNDGVLFRRLPVSPDDCRPSPTGESNMPVGNQIDLDLALRETHELALASGDAGHAYWCEVGQLLRRAAGMQAQIDALSGELERCRAMHRAKN